MVLNYFMVVCFLSVHLMTMEVHGCRIEIDADIGKPQPILIEPGTEDFVQPTFGTITVDTDDEIEFFCPPSTLMTAKCQGDGLFTVDGKKNVHFVKVYCTEAVKSIARRTDQLCYGDATLIEIGFEVSITRFLRVMEICYDKRIESTLYAKYTIPKYILPYQNNQDRPDFQTGIFYDESYKVVNDAYNIKNQNRYFEKLFGPTFVKEFFDLDNKKGKFFSRGHLAAKADFTLKPQQDSTFYFVNVAPQWQQFNRGNWGKVEDRTRKLADRMELNLEIYTGTFGVLTLKDKDLYLLGGNKIPIPELFYRVVIDKFSRAGIVIVGVNDPFGGEGSNNNCKSNNIINEVSWLNFDSTSSSGYLYACEFSHFTSFVPHLTSVTVNGILK